MAKTKCDDILTARVAAVHSDESEDGLLNVTLRCKDEGIAAIVMMGPKALLFKRALFHMN